MKYLSERERTLHEITGIFGKVLEDLERTQGGFRSKNLRMLRFFCDAFCEEYKRTIPPMASLTVVREE